MSHDEPSVIVAHATARLALALATTSTPDAVLAAVLEHGLPAVGARAGNVFLVDGPAGVLRLAGTRGYAGGFMDAHAVIALDAPLPITRAVRDGQAQLLASTDVALSYPWMPRDPTGGGGRIAALPLTVGGCHFGVIALSYPHDAPFTREEHETLTTIASLCAHAVQRARVSEQAERDARRTVQILDCLGDAVITIDADETVTFVNSTARRWFEVPHDVTAGRPLHALLPDDETRDLVGVIRSTRLGSTPWRGELCLLDGTRWFDVRVAPLEEGGTVAHLREVTYRKTVERQLNRSRERLLLALDASGMAMWDWNLVTNDLTWTGAMHALIGAPHDAPVSFETFLARVHPDDRDHLVQVVSDLVGRGGTIDEEFRVVRMDGSVRWLRSIGDVRTRNGRGVRSVGVNYDVTSHKDLERALRDANEHLEVEVAQRTAHLRDLNAELTGYASALSRDLAEPVRRVAGFLTLLERRYGDVLHARERSLFSVIKHEAQRAASLVRELAELAQHDHQPLTLRDVPLSLIVPQVISDLAGEAQGRQVEWHVGHLPTVRADPMLVRQVFTCLLHNALKFTRPRAVARIEIDTGAQPGAHHVWIRDNGVGFEPHDAEHLFQVLPRLEQSGEGVGMGLSTVRRIVARHGGRVWAEGQRGEGATFHLTLPV